MKKLIIFLVISSITIFAQAQNVGFGIAPGTEKLTINGNIKFTDTGQIISHDLSHRILFRRNEQLLELREAGNIIFSSGVTTGNQTGTMIITANQNVGIGTLTPDPSALLELSSNSKGFMPPSVTYAERNTIASPVAGLTVWCNNCDTAGELQVYNGNAWTNAIGGPANVYIPNRVRIGDAYQGGIVAYILLPGDPGFDYNVQHGIIVTSSDQLINQGGAWLYGTNYGSLNTTAAGIALGTGNANTNGIIANQPTPPYVTPAKVCYDLSLNGYSDWWLPSKDELNKLYINRAIIGGFSAATYWTSTYFVSTGTSIITGRAWSQNFSDGAQSTIPVSYGNGNGTRQRAIRSF
jgi:hypothetical protein